MCDARLRLILLLLAAVKALVVVVLFKALIVTAVTVPAAITWLSLLDVSRL